jgi:hypothetical protein
MQTDCQIIPSFSCFLLKRKKDLFSKLLIGLAQSGFLFTHYFEKRQHSLPF